MSKEHVLVPVAMYQAMALCFYGNGPRAHERVKATGPLEQEEENDTLETVIGNEVYVPGILPGNELTRKRLQGGKPRGDRSHIPTEKE